MLLLHGVTEEKNKDTIKLYITVMKEYPKTIDLILLLTFDAVIKCGLQGHAFCGLI